MIDQIISHYQILAKLGEVPKSPMSVFPRVDATLSIPTCLPDRQALYVGSCKRRS